MTYYYPEGWNWDWEAEEESKREWEEGLKREREEDAFEEDDRTAEELLKEAREYKEWLLKFDREFDYDSRWGSSYEDATTYEMIPFLLEMVDGEIEELEDAITRQTM